MITKAKYAGVCHRCGTAIRPGHWIETARGGTWGGEVARHAACQTEREREIAPFDHDKGRYVKPSELSENSRVNGGPVDRRLVGGHVTGARGIPSVPSARAQDAPGSVTAAPMPVGKS